MFAIFGCCGGDELPAHEEWLVHSPGLKHDTIDEKPSHYVAKMAVPVLGFTRKVPVCHFCERLGAAAATEF